MTPLARRTGNRLSARRLNALLITAAACCIGPAALPDPASATSLPSTITSNTTLTAAGSPWTGASVTINSGVTVTVDPDAVVKLSGTLTANGTLDVNGTAANPAVFTSSADSAPGQWNGIRLASSSSTVDHATVRHAKAAITVSGAVSPSITNSTITDNSWQGIASTANAGASPTITDNAIADNGMHGIYLEGGGSPTISSNTIHDNYPTGPVATGGGITFKVGVNKTGQVNITDNDLQGNGGSTALLVWTTDISGTITGTPTLAGNEISDNAGTALYYQVGNGPIPADIDTIPEPSGNGSDAVYVSGQIQTSTTWEDPGYPLVVIGGFDLKVNAGKTLTLGPGLVVKAETTTSDIWVWGTLDVAGDPGDPVTITSLKDDSVGGDTNGDGIATAPAAGNWGGIYFHGNLGAGGELERLHASYGGYGNRGLFEAQCPCASPLSLRHSKLTRGAYGLVARGDLSSAAPTIEWNTIAENTAYGIYKYNSTGVFAKGTDFGSDAGPAPQGSGNAVSTNVTYTLDGSKADCAGKQAGGDGAEDGHCPKKADPVSLTTGALSYAHTDLKLTNSSTEPLAFTRSYSSNDRSDAGFGPGWAHSGLALVTEQESGDALLRRADGRRDLYTKVGSVYEPPSGVHDTLSKLASGAFRLTTLDRTVYDFRLDGRIDAITDDHGLITDYAYNSSGRLASITDPSGQTLSFTYDAANHITNVTDSAAREVSFTYTAAGDLDTVTDALGGVTDYGYDAERRLETIKDPRGITFLSNDYDAQGRVVEQTDGEGNVWTIDYAAGEATVTEPEGGETTDEFDSQYRTTAVTDQLGNTTSYSYDAAGNVDEITRPGGSTTTLDYDSAGNLTEATDPEGGVRSYTYDSTNRLTGFTDERNSSWSYTWSSANDLTEIDGPGAADTEIDYNAAGQPTEITDPNSNATTLAYDSRGNLTSITDPLSHATSYGYDSYNNLISTTRPGLAAETYERNKLADLLSITTPEGHQSSFDYDENGALVSVTDPALNVWEIERDNMERPTAYVDPLDQRTEIAYDGNLNPVSLTDRRDETTTYAYDLANQLIEIDAPDTGAWELGYDARGNRDELIDPRSNTTTYDYDLADRLIQASEPLSTETDYGYDAAGNLTSITDPRSNETSLAYDDLGRLTELNQPLSKTTTYDYDPAGNLIERQTAEDTLTLAYDDADRLSSISDATTTLRSFAHDAADRLSEATDVQAKTLEFGYDDDGNLVSIDDDRGQTVSRSFDSRGNLDTQTDGRGTIDYAYDELKRITQLTDPNSEMISFDYDPEGNLTETELPNGVTTTNAYDGAGRITETSSLAGSTVLQSFDYAHDAAGNRTSQTDRNSDTTTYSYDALGRLSEFDPPAAAAVGYAYDAAGNRTAAGSVTYTYNALNQLTSDSTGSDYGYDGAGRLVDETNGSQATAYAYDALDQLIEVDDGSDPIAYSYDGLGRRSGRTQASATETAHYGDLTDRASLDTDSGAIVESFIQGPAGLVEQETGAGVQFPLPDAHGDLRTLTDDAGALASRQDYDPWGEQLSGPALEMGWLGSQERRFDPSAGLVQMGVRAYAPGLGRFLSEDPVLGFMGLGQSLSRYGYVLGDPLSKYDLTGRTPTISVGPVDFCVGGIPIWGGCAGPFDLPGPSPEELIGGVFDDATELFGERAAGLIKGLNYSLYEAIGNAANSAAGAAVCGAAKKTLLGKSGGGKAMKAACAVGAAASTGSTLEDITDDDNDVISPLAPRDFPR